MKKYFLTGLVTLLPLAVTIWVVRFAVNLLTKPFVGIVTSFLDRFPTRSFGIITSHEVIRTASQILILIALFLFVLFLGFVARKYFFSELIRLGDRIMKKIPLVNKVYKISKEIIQSLFVSDKNAFRQVVMLPFPYKGCYCLGLVSNDAPKTCSDAQNGEMLSVFLPTTPNPTTGFLVMCHSADLIFLDMRTEDAIQYIVSCAVVQPHQEKSQ
ncbi:MAG: hypothetical protein A3E80_05495 [Chlamydiae bacterium RIFCSPHIGHO2_12_FULL_49_9]|nr:MAG: hypothetical protein A3E80_05495 [Chlamydiae bacterium RIFCSPHIGHO2_12_FULL_49_9]